MLKYYIKVTEGFKNLCEDNKGVVSFEYIIVACCVIGAVGLVFGGTGITSISGMLSTGLGKISTAFAAAIPATP
jgi:pilus assembly protein Flp/PilA